MFDQSSPSTMKLTVYTPFLLLFLSYSSSFAQISQSLFHLAPFDPAVLAIGRAEDSLIQLDEITFMKEEALRIQQEEEAAQKQLMAANAAARTKSPQTNRTRADLEELDVIVEMPSGSMAFHEKIAQFPKEIRKKVPSNAIFLDESDGEGMAALDIDNTQSIKIMEDRIEHIMTVRFEKVRIATLSIRVYKFGGSLVYSKKLYEKPIGYQFDINYSKWPTGVYRFQTKIDDGAWKEKVIVKYK